MAAVLLQKAKSLSKRQFGKYLIELSESNDSDHELIKAAIIFKFYNMLDSSYKIEEFYKNILKKGSQDIIDCFNQYGDIRTIINANKHFFNDQNNNLVIAKHIAIVAADIDHGLKVNLMKRSNLQMLSLMIENYEFHKVASGPGILSMDLLMFKPIQPYVQTDMILYDYRHFEYNYCSGFIFDSIAKYIHDNPVGPSMINNKFGENINKFYIKHSARINARIDFIHFEYARIKSLPEIMPVNANYLELTKYATRHKGSFNLIAKLIKFEPTLICYANHDIQFILACKSGGEIMYCHPRVQGKLTAYRKLICTVKKWIFPMEILYLISEF